MFKSVAVTEVMAANYVCGRVPPFISHYQNSAFCVSIKSSEKLSEELIAISDAESARGQVKEPLVSTSTLSYLEKHKRRGKTLRSF